MSPKPLPCLFLVGVSCMERKGKSREYMVGRVCPKCHFYDRFVRETEEEEDEFWEAEGRARRGEFCLICACRLDGDSRSDVLHVCRGCSGTLEM